MSLRDQIRGFGAQGAATHLAAFGHPCIYKGLDFLASATAIKNRKKLRDGGFTAMGDLDIRFPKSQLRAIPESETPVKVDGKIYRIIEVKNISDPVDEWVLTLTIAG